VDRGSGVQVPLRPRSIRPIVERASAGLTIPNLRIFVASMFPSKLAWVRLYLTHARIAQEILIDDGPMNCLGIGIIQGLGNGITDVPKPLSLGHYECEEG
jgi:hypothetical protein